MPARRAWTSALCGGSSRPYPLVGKSEGLKHAAVINCDQLTRLEKNLLTDYIGKLSAEKLQHLRLALRVALGIE